VDTEQSLYSILWKEVVVARGAITYPTLEKHAEGQWGLIETAAGSISYLLTSVSPWTASDFSAAAGIDHSAQSGEVEQSRSRRLRIEDLRPVREAWTLNDLSFQELVQRDLDDYRVSSQLIPYLIGLERLGDQWRVRRAGAPVFFPPLTAVLLPRPAARLTEQTAFPTRELTDPDTGIPIRQEWASSFMSLAREITGTDPATLSPNRWSRLGWDPRLMELVVVDGQHRAMAMLALARELHTRLNPGRSDAWSDAPRYRVFYEKAVADLLSAAKRLRLPPPEVEVPVTVVWFPDRLSDLATSIPSARALFVDVNREAKPPTGARLILLGDNDLSNVFTRRLLEMARVSAGPELIPMEAIDIDRPAELSTAGRKWSCSTSIDVLNEIVLRVLWGPERRLDEPDKSAAGRPDSADVADALMRKQLDLAQLRTLFPTGYFEESGVRYNLGNLGRHNFPRARLNALEERFGETWGISSHKLLSVVSPYASHVSGLEMLRKEMEEVPNAADLHLQLAGEAIFDTSGLYWSLRQLGESASTAPASVPAKAWAYLRSSRTHFEDIRLESWCQTIGADTSLRDCRDALDGYLTGAVQVGLVLAFATIFRQAWKSRSVADLPHCADEFAHSLNESLVGVGQNGLPRALLMGEWDSGGMRVAGLDLSKAVEMRNLWLELLLVATLPNGVNEVDALKMLRLSRDLYRKRVETAQRRILRRSETLRPSENRASFINRVEQKAQRRAREELRQRWLDWGLRGEDLSLPRTDVDDDTDDEDDDELVDLD
jgi:hypothetical protein